MKIGENINIFHSDCMDFMKTMSDDSVDCVLTSPPYNCNLNYPGYDDNRDYDEFLEFIRNVYTELFRVCDEGSRIYSVVSDRLMFDMKSTLEDIGFIFVQILVWCKPNLSYAGRISSDWNNMTESILLFRKGRRTPMTNSFDNKTNTHNFFVIASPQSNFTDKKVYPAQFPISLPNKILSRTPVEKSVFDPFMGSGTVGVACAMQQKPFVGCEISEEGYSIAKQRIKKELEQKRLNIPCASQSDMFESLSRIKNLKN